MAAWLPQTQARRRAAPNRPVHLDPSRWSALPVLLAGAFMVVLDFFIVNVALPAIATDLGAGESSLEWVVAGYGLAFAAFLITAGRLGDLSGAAASTSSGSPCSRSPRSPAGWPRARPRW